VELVKFNKMEVKVKGVISEYALLKKRNQELEEYLKKIELELEGARGRIEELNEEKDVIRTKVDMLLDLLRDIEVVD
jgi:FtsZ-binding cell division protein ZapB